MTAQPPRLAFNLDHDVQVLSAMTSHLSPYLYEDEIYGHMPGGDLPKLTLGGLLLRLYRLTRLDALLTSEQQTAVQDARLNFEAECSKWAVHYEKKLQKELGIRINALDQFLKDCGEDRQSCMSGYPIQAEKRTMIEHLKDRAAQNNVLTPELLTHLIETDARLRRYFKPDGFVFDERLLDVYPADPFWWLHGHIPESK